jgi:hypothetical protein
MGLALLGRYCRFDGGSTVHLEGISLDEAVYAMGRYSPTWEQSNSFD